MGFESRSPLEGRGQGRGERGWPAEVVQEGSVCIHMVPHEQRATERVAVQNRQCRLRQMQMWRHDDRDTRCERVSGTGPVETVWKDWREALGGRAVSKKEAEEEGDLLGAFFFRNYEFLISFANPPSVIHRPSVPARYAINFVPAAVTLPAFHLTSTVLSPSSSTPVSTDYSVVSLVDFVRPSVSSSTRYYIPTST